MVIAQRPFSPPPLSVPPGQITHDDVCLLAVDVGWWNAAFMMMMGWDNNRTPWEKICRGHLLLMSSSIMCPRLIAFSSYVRQVHNALLEIADRLTVEGLLCGVVTDAREDDLAVMDRNSHHPPRRYTAGLCAGPCGQRHSTFWTVDGPQSPQT